MTTENINEFKEDGMWRSQPSTENKGKEKASVRVCPSAIL